MDAVSIDTSAPAADALGELRGGRNATNRNHRGLPGLDPDPHRPVAIVFTSGTTGTPKGAVFSNRQLDAVSSMDGGRRWGAGGRNLATTSFAHLGYMTKLPQALRSGGTTFLLDRWSTEEALQMVERHAISILAGIPTQLALMMRHERFDATDTSSVRLVVIGGGPAAPSLVREARLRLGVPVTVRYTCTEAAVGTGTGPDDPPEDAESSVGRPRGNVELTIRDTAGSSLGPGVVGEVCLRSAAVMDGYYRDPESTASAFTADGAVRTGDLGLVDDRGRLRLVGRLKEMYVRGGYNVFPTEVEAVLEDHPDVAHAAIAPRADAVMGEIGVAVVVPRNPGRPPTLHTLRDHAARRLAAFKLPEDLVITDQLPLTAMAKLDRRALAALVTRCTDPDAATRATTGAVASGPPIRLLPLLDTTNSFFWTSGADGKLRFLHCGECGHYVHPSAPRCPYCLAGSLTPRPVSGRGTLHSFTVNHQQWIPGSEPYLIGLVTIDEQEDVRLTTNLVGCTPEQVYIGMEVEVIFDHHDDIWLPLFQPAGSTGSPSPGQAQPGQRRKGILN